MKYENFRVSKSKKEFKQINTYFWTIVLYVITLKENTLEIGN